MKIKKSLVIVLVCMLALSSVGCGGGAGAESEPVDIVVASDMHHISQKLTDNGEYFMRVVNSGDGKVSHHSEAIMEAFLYEQKVNKPDVLILSGDITMNGATESHRDLVEKLYEVKEAGIAVLVIPGNHDVDKDASYSFSGDTYDIAESLDSAGFIEMYHDFGLAQAISTDGVTFSYIYEAAPDLWVAMIDTNTYGIGYVKDQTLEWLEGELKTAKKKGINVIGVTHQNLFAHSELLSFGYQIYNAKELIALFDEYNVELNLSGHIHIQSVHEENDITEIATSSLATTYIQYGAMHYDGETIGYEVRETDVEGWAADNGITDETLNNFSQYAPEFFKESGRSKVREGFAGSGLTEEEISILAETFAQLNEAYFAGKPIDPATTMLTETETLADGIALWQEQQDSFRTRYINSMAEAADEERRYITVEF